MNDMNDKTQPYSNREIDTLKDTLIARIDTSDETNKTAHRNTADTLTRIEAQTTKTNGRVTSLEKNSAKQKDVEELKRWQSYVIGFCACISVVFIPVILMLVKLYLSKP